MRASSIVRWVSAVAVAVSLIFAAEAVAKEKKGQKGEGEKGARDDKAKTEEVVLTGKLTVTGKGGRLTAELQTEDGTKYSLVMGKDTPALTADMDGKTATVLGKVAGNKKALVKKVIVRQLDVSDDAAPAPGGDKPAGEDKPAEGGAVNKAL